MASFSFVSDWEDMNPSCRNQMEDHHCVIDAFGGVIGQAFLAVYDGHGGRGIVDFLAERLHLNLIEELQHKGQDGEVRPVDMCLKSSFLITDIQSSKQGLNVSGSTAATCLLRQEDNACVLYTANVGDTRAVLCRNGTACRLTRDHKASDCDEIDRIEKAGGFVLRKRVLGILSVSRSFGDHAMKKFVSATPHTCTTILRDTDSFLILACDGVWDVLSDQEAVDFVRENIEKDPSASKKVAKLLVEEALSRGSTDNVTALVVGLTGFIRQAM